MQDKEYDEYMDSLIEFLEHQVKELERLGFQPTVQVLIDHLKQTKHEHTTV